MRYISRFGVRFKNPQWTTLIIIDSQAVKNTCNASAGTNGFCFYKTTNGIKRHLVVDMLGFSFFMFYTPANGSDDVGLPCLLIQKRDYFRAKTMSLPEITILLDHGYHPENLSLFWQRCIHQS